MLGVLEADKKQVALSERKIQWNYIVEGSLWWGGFYERLVKSVKTPLKKIFAKAMLDAEQLATILTEIEAQLNSRPLTYLSADPGDYSVITPAQILMGEIFKRLQLRTPVFRNTLLEPSLNVFSIIKNLSMDFGSVGMLST